MKSTVVHKAAATQQRLRGLEVQYHPTSNSFAVSNLVALLGVVVIVLGQNISPDGCPGIHVRVSFYVFDGDYFRHLCFPKISGVRGTRKVA